jgi:phosphodiesterase/alkaline phosphatase D-like protein
MVAEDFFTRARLGGFGGVMSKVAGVLIIVIFVVLFAGCAGSDENPPVTSGISTPYITERMAVIAWITNEPSDSQVEYGPTTNYGLTTPLDEDLMSYHCVGLYELAPDTTYHFRVKSKDTSGNEVVSQDKTFATLPDTSAPIISEVIAYAHAYTCIDDTTTASIIWTTDEPATSEVEYGLTTSYGSTASSLLPALVTDHSVSLRGLDPSTTYHYRVKSEDAAGNESASADYTLTTAAIEYVSGTGTIVFLRFEGRFYGIFSDDGGYYDPINLSQEFQVEGLRICFVAKICKGLAGLHMWGSLIEIVAIERI